MCIERKSRVTRGIFSAASGWFAGFALTLALALPAPAQTLHYSWQTELVDAFGKYPAIAVDSRKNVHVSYVRPGTGIMYGFRAVDSGHWFTMPIDTQGGPNNVTTGITLDSQGNPHVCYTPGPMKVNSFDGKKWNVEWVGTSPVTIEYNCSIEVASDGTIHIAWYHTHRPDGSDLNHLAYAARRDKTWETRTLDSDFASGKWNSIALDAQGNPRIAYSSFAGVDLRYATFDGTQWVHTTIDSGYAKDGGAFDRGFGVSLVLYKDGQPGISYYENGTLKYAKKEGDRWKIKVIDHINPSDSWDAYISSQVLDSHGMPHICYEDSGAVKHAYWDGTKWQTQLLTIPGIAGRTPHMAIDSSDTIYIVYRDPVETSIRVAIGTLVVPAENAAAQPAAKESH